jgi:2,3-diketo-5-methylthio-1-phosphopentane phosphatase
MIPTPHALLLDIEGTTTSISFVYDTLFPWMRQHVGDFLERHLHRDDVRESIELIRQQVDADLAHDLPGIIPLPDTLGDDTVDAVLANVHTWMDADRKLTALKQLQGLVWDDGYATGQLRGHLYDDVVPLLDRARDRGIDVAIYSSGSVHAQKLLFGHSVAGDLTPRLCAFFDTTTGPKKEARSYRAIAAELDLEPEQILFVSDNIDEIRAAHAAGMDVRVSVRPGTAELPQHPFVEIHGFDDLLA